MRKGGKSAGAALGALLLVATWHAGARAQICDENDPGAPARTTKITLGASDFTDEARDMLRSFIVTGSLGKVTASVVSATPPGIVRSLSALPEISNYSPHYGEQLKGIDIRVALRRSERAAVVSVSLRQVCAQSFRDSFLY
jgi:hypothetical protein